MSDEALQAETTLILALAANERQTRILARSLRVIEKLIDACVTPSHPSSPDESPPILGFADGGPEECEGPGDE